MDKYIYGLVGSSYLLKRREIRGNKDSLYIVDTNSIELASEIAFTLEHDPKLLINTTKHSNMELFRNAEGVFFRYPIKTDEDNRLYRMVKLGRYKQCSYTRLLGEFRRKVDWEENWPLSNEKMFIEKKSLLYEICLTNKPFDQYTFCTVYKGDKRLRNVDWDNPLEFGKKENPEQKELKLNKRLRLLQEYQELEEEQQDILSVISGQGGIKSGCL